MKYSINKTKFSVKSLNNRMCYVENGVLSHKDKVEKLHNSVRNNGTF